MDASSFIKFSYSNSLQLKVTKPGSISVWRLYPKNFSPSLNCVNHSPSKHGTNASQSSSKNSSRATKNKKISGKRKNSSSLSASSYSITLWPASRWAMAYAMKSTSMNRPAPFKTASKAHKTTHPESRVRTSTSRSLAS